MVKMPARLAGVLLPLLLASCGGGAGGGNNGAQDNSWLSISPSSVSVSTVAGASAPFSITATSSKTISQSLYPVLIDSGGVIDPQATVITAISQMSYKASLATSKTLSQGSHKGHLSLWLYTNTQHTSAYPGSPWTIPYQVTVGPVRVAHKLLPDAVGVAFSSTPGGSRLTRSIAVADNLGKATSWQAVSDKSWLQVTGTGTTGTSGTALTLTADPTGLPSDAISYATVTLSSSDTTVQPIEKIQVGCWKGTNSAQRTDVLGINPGDGGDHIYCHVCPDPVRPYIYLAYGNQVYGSTSGNIVDCYNIYTATRVSSVALPDRIGNAGSMAIAPDGSALYVVDYDGYESGLYKISLPGMTLEGPIQSTPFSTNVEITYARPNGVGVILSGEGTAVRASTGALLANTGFDGYMAATADSGRMFVGNGYAGNGVVSRYSMDFSEFGGGTLVTPLLNATSGTPALGFAEPIAVSRDGARLYWQTPMGFGMVRLDPVSLSVLNTFPTTYWYTGIRVANDGRLFCSGQNPSNLGCSLLTFGPDDGLISTQEVKDLSSGENIAFGQDEFDVSSDSMVVIVNSHGGIHFFPVYP